MLARSPEIIAATGRLYRLFARVLLSNKRLCLRSKGREVVYLIKLLDAWAKENKKYIQNSADVVCVYFLYLQYTKVEESLK